MPRNQLTPKQEKFKKALLDGANQTNAAIAAGYAAETAHVTGCRLAKHPLIAGAKARRDALAEKTSAVAKALTAQKVLEATNAALEFDPGELFDDQGKLLNIKQMPLEARKCIQSIDGDKVKVISRLGVIELSAKLLGMLKVEQNTTVPVQIIVAPSAVSERVVTVEPSKILPEWG